uniref:Uncharacterized protein n=1 Tax=Candidatus Kentrum sp. LFY TaxID=2126342 RepID=A0A450UAX0_9GAMM|nr:MAG: hypothetical protein BECKLFY1418A_GA0070994_100719 [Candidatus Kentron sp. LFY]
MWHWVVQQQQVGEHLDGAIGHVPVDEGFLERTIPKEKHEPAIDRLFHLDLRDAGHPLLHTFQHALEGLPMFLVQELRHQHQIIPGDG